MVTAYLLAQRASTPLYGKLGDQHGRNLVSPGQIIIILAGSALCATRSRLIVCRAIQGIRGGGLMVTARAIVPALADRIAG